MSEKELASSIDAALAHVDPNRRKFLEILLAGVAAAPLLNSASLTAEDKAAGQQGKVFPKTETSIKGDTAIKDGSANTIKSTNQTDKTIKYWTQKGDIKSQEIKGENSTIKNDSRTIKGESPAIKYDSNTIKGANSTIKLQSTPIKGESPALKLESQPIKGASTAIKGETKPTPK
jgi:hypothetical protein